MEEECRENEGECEGECEGEWRENGGRMKGE